MENQSISSVSSRRANIKLRLVDQIWAKVTRKFKCVDQWRLLKFKAKRTSWMRSEWETGFAWSAPIWTSLLEWPATGASEIGPLVLALLRIKMNLKNSNRPAAPRSTFELTPPDSTFKLLASSLAPMIWLHKKVSQSQHNWWLTCLTRVTIQFKACCVDFLIKLNWISQDASRLTPSKKHISKPNESFKSVLKKATAQILSRHWKRSLSPPHLLD